MLRPFLDNLETAVKSQIWIAITAYLLIAVYRKEAALEVPLSEILHFFAGVLFNKVTIQSLFCKPNYTSDDAQQPKQLSLLPLSTRH
jgi:hypothetical protein